MKNLGMILLTGFLLVSSATAGEIFGTILAGGKPAPKGTKVEVICGQKSYTSASDAYGSFRLFVPEKGKCTLKVYIDKQSPSIDITSYEKSTRCDISIEHKDGRFSLKRK